MGKSIKVYYYTDGTSIKRSRSNFEQLMRNNEIRTFSPKDYALVFEGSISESFNNASYFGALEEVFFMFNTQGNPLITEEKQRELDQLNARHTSLSVGDMVELEGKMYMCTSLDWIEVAEEGKESNSDEN